MFKKAPLSFRRKGSSKLEDSQTGAVASPVPAPSAPPAQKALSPPMKQPTLPAPASKAAPVVDASKRPTKKLESLQALRYITALQMVGFHYFQNTPYPLFNRANAWGKSIVFVVGWVGGR